MTPEDIAKGLIELATIGAGTLDAEERAEGFNRRSVGAEEASSLG